MRTRWALAEIPRPDDGLRFAGAHLPGDMRSSGQPGVAFGRFSRQDLTVGLPGVGGLFSQVHLLIGFDPTDEEDAAMAFCRADVFANGELTRTKTLQAISLQRCLRGSMTEPTFFGDGTSFMPVGCVPAGGAHIPVALVSIELDPTETANELKLSFAPRAEFVLFDVFLEFTSKVTCPFHSSSSGVSLAELASVIRIGDRVRFEKALKQLSENMSRVATTDEARAFSLSFAAVVSAAMLEMGAPRSVPQTMLNLARKIDRTDSIEEIIRLTEREVRTMVEPVLVTSDRGAEKSMDHAIAFVARNYSQDLSDESMALELGLSPSHFRYLFKKATGKPFHQYLLGVRLEQARQMISDHSLTVSETAFQVGFRSPAHFTRAFVKRFGIRPSEL